MPDISSCPSCGARYKTGGLASGKRLRCKKCQSVFAVPEDSSNQPIAAAPEGRLDAAEAGKDADHALPAALGDRSSLARAKFQGGVSLPGSSSQGTIIGPPPGAPPQDGSKPADDEKYAVEDEIARGGMGAILRAVDRDIRREVAMKVMLDDADEKKRARFVEEAQVTGQLEHPNIVPIHELGVDAEGRMFFTMKLVQGRSLADVLKGLRRKDAAMEAAFPLGRLLNAFINVCNAMAFAHAKGVVHRDLKPANIMLGDYGEVLVMDWGLAKVLGAACGGEAPPAPEAKPAAPGQARADDGREQDSRDERLSKMVQTLRQESGELTQDGTVIGTPHYMPPEQAEGLIGEIDARSDVYSLGAILYEVQALKPPCEADNIHALILNVVQGKITPPEQRAPERGIPRELSAIAMKALALKKEDRYQRAEELRRDVELFLEGRAVSAKPDTAWETIVKLVKRNKGASIATAAAVIVVAVLVSVGYWLNLQERCAAETARGTAEEARLKSDAALTAFKEEQAKREEQEKGRKADRANSAPLFLENARQAVLRSDFDGAMLQVEVAANYDPELAEARMLKAQLLIVKGNYPEATRELEQYLRLRPEDEDAQGLREVCSKVEGEETISTANAVANIFRKQKAYTLADAKMPEKILEPHIKRIREKWGPGISISISAGKLVLDFKAKSDVSDISVLSGMPIKELHLHGTSVSDVGPLQGMPLRVLSLDRTPVTDLSPLQGLQLALLRIEGTGITSLACLHGMPLRELSIRDTKVTDLSPLDGMPLKVLQLRGTPVKDLRPLKGMRLEDLNIAATGVTNLAPIEGMPLRSLSLDGLKISSFEPLRGMPLRWLLLQGGNIKDLRVLEGMPLQDLGLFWTAVRDITPLRGMKLTRLSLVATQVTDITPLEGMSIEEFEFTPKNITKGLEIIRSMKSLRKIGASGFKLMPPAEFWRRYDAGEFNK